MVTSNSQHSQWDKLPFLEKLFFIWVRVTTPIFCILLIHFVTVFYLTPILSPFLIPSERFSMYLAQKLPTVNWILEISNHCVFLVKMKFCHVYVIGENLSIKRECWSKLKILKKKKKLWIKRMLTQTCSPSFPWYILFVKISKLVFQSSPCSGNHLSVNLMNFKEVSKFCVCK